MTAMRCLIGALVLLMFTLPVRAQEPSEIDERLQEAYELMLEGSKQLGDEATRDQGIATYERACQLYAEILQDVQSMPLPADARSQVAQLAHYNTACARSLQGRSAEALDALSKAFDAGWDDMDHTAKDPDLDPLRSLPRYSQLISKAKASLEAKALSKAQAAIAQGKLFAYDFSVTTLDGKPLRLGDLKGKVVIVDYWGTWCEPCREEIPHFVELKREFGDKLAVVGLAWEQGEVGAEEEAKVETFAGETKINYPLALLEGQDELRKIPGFSAFPTTLFVDKAGNVRAKEVGYRDLRTLRALVKVLDAETGAPAAPAKKKKLDDDWF